MFNISGKVAFITGAGSGIGRTLAIALASQGVKVGCFDNNAEASQATVDSINTNGAEAIAFSGDVADYEQVQLATKALQAHFGSLDFAINNAGIAHQAPAESLEMADWNRMIGVNLTGVFVCAQAEARIMLNAGSGSIINIASMSGSIVNRGLTQSHYNASKAGVKHLTKSLAAEWATRGVRVNSISPGYTLTPMTQRDEVAAMRGEWMAQTPMNRMVEMSELVGPTIFLLSGASSACTGLDLVVDAGFTLW
jgi:NAD(P)-dependent dehydrogenase (short-subunit alcohol dehydrogenase family)